MKDHTIYRELSSTQYKMLVVNSLLIVTSYDELPPLAILHAYNRNYRILQHTTQLEKHTNKPLFVYICEDIYG